MRLYQNSARFSCMVFVCKWYVNNIDFYAFASHLRHHIRSKRIWFSQFHFVRSFIHSKHRHTTWYTYAKNSSMFINFFSIVPSLSADLQEQSKQGRKLRRWCWKNKNDCHRSFLWNKHATWLNWIELNETNIRNKLIGTFVDFGFLFNSFFAHLRKINSGNHTRGGQ